MDVPSCRLCGAALPEEGGLRCPNCGLHQAADLGRSGYRRLALGLAGIYVLTTLLVLLIRNR
ncbi:MAG: hypothetical protein ACRDYF_20595 [Acidimicrobiia bacterium]